MTTTTNSTTVVCGVPIDDLTLAQTVDRVGEFVERGRQTGRTHQVVTVNVDFLVNAQSDAELLDLLQRADLAVADGMPVVWSARLLGDPVQERVAGADLVPALAARAASAGHSLYLFGAADGIASRAADVLAARHPGLDVVGESGPFVDDPADMDPSVIDRIRASGPDILCVALGHPKQEKWIDLHRAQLGVPVLIGVGGSIDFLVGHKRRAPRWMQRSGTEWMHRIAQEPGRLVQRYTRDIVRFGPALAREYSLLRRAIREDAPPPSVERHGDTTVVRSHGRLQLDAATLGWSAHEWRAPRAGQQVVIDVADQDVVSHGEVCALVGLAKRLHSAGSELALTSVTPALARTLLQLQLYCYVPTSSGPHTPGRRLTNSPTAAPMSVGVDGFHTRNRDAMESTRA